MSALAHMIEATGTPTVAIAIVRNQAERTRPPRALFVPFQLGRPVGTPNDVVFQRRVLRAALALLERRDGPVILEDFPDQDVNWHDTAGWLSPLPSSAEPFSIAAFEAERAALGPAWIRAQARFGRTTVGLAGQPPASWSEFASEVLSGGLPTVAAHPTTALAVRFLCDDIKAMYGEAAAADGPAPSARQIDTWFWRQTQAGALLKALRRAGMESGNNALRTVSGRFFVPAPWL